MFDLTIFYSPGQMEVSSDGRDNSIHPIWGGYVASDLHGRLLLGRKFIPPREELSEMSRDALCGI